MENFIDYVICSLMSNGIKCRKSRVANNPIWVMTFEDRIVMTFDEDDVNTVRQIYEKRKYVLDAEDSKKYQLFLSYCQ